MKPARAGGSIHAIMWCPKCGGEYREGIYLCPACSVDLVAEKPATALRVGPLTGRPIEEEIEATGPAIAGTFVTMEEAQSALRALSEAGIPADVVNRDEQFPMSISGVQPGFGIAVPETDLGGAQEILRNRGFLPVAIGRYRREEEVQQAFALLESKGLRPRVSKIVLDDVPPDFRGDVEPYVLEVPAEEEGRANDALAGTIMKICENCGGQIFFGDVDCRSCGEHVTS
ncbi:MAG TPA: hypothetical protein VNI57_03900 [Candidatus Saccharimonadales bacterium]|nr:hypothetical protein [Candidatus Saccharimonadales bacterium]